MTRQRVAYAAVALLFSSNVGGSTVIPFVETFDGQGGFSSSGRVIGGLDHPGWSISGDSSLHLSDGAFVYSNRGHDIGLGDDADQLSRDQLVGIGSFSTKITFSDVEFGLIGLADPPVHNSGLVQLVQRIGDNELADSLGLAVTASSSTPPEVWRASFLVGLDFDNVLVTPGTNVSLEFRYDSVLSNVTFLYDNDTTDEIAASELATIAHTGTVKETHEILLNLAASQEGVSDGRLLEFSITPFSNIPGDFNGNGVLDVLDIDLLSEAVRTGDNELPFDLTADALVNEDDRRHWVLDLKNTYFGDANLDGEFASSDLINIFTAGEHEDNVALNSTWATGDWNGDGDFTTGDLVLAFTEGGYEAGPRAAVVVPEPGVSLAMLSTVILWSGRRRRS